MSSPLSAKDGRVPQKQNPKSGGKKPASLRSRIVTLLKKRALDKVEISKTLNLPANERASLRELLRQMEIAGEVARIRKDRYIVPETADLFTGVIQFHASGAAHVLNEKAGQADLYISGENTWTAMHGDRVVARINAGRPGRDRTGRQEGTVIRILERVNETIVGTLQKSKNFFYVVSDDPRFVHGLTVPAPVAPLYANVGDKVVAKLDSWPTRQANPEGHVVEVLGPAGSPGVDMLSIIRKHRLPVQFPPEVQRDAEQAVINTDPREISHREDLRKRFVFTIDPDDARDFDDAIHVERTSRGWEVGIHIADVSHFVKPKSPLDREALSRGNSVYLADRVIPMLPEALSNGICSLRPNEDRFTFSVFAEINPKGKVLSARFAKTIIRSVARLTYKQAYAHLQKPAHDELTHHLHMAWEVASMLRRNRFTHGSLDLEFPEVKVILDSQGKPIRLEKIENDISHQLIEELMLLANEQVARQLTRNRQTTIHRVHEKPDPDKLAEFRETVLSSSVKVGDLTQRPELQRLIAITKGKPEEYVVKLGLLKSLKRARYATEALGHYGLHKSDYAHFTSPIRRYADLVVHRSLERHLGLTRQGPDSGALNSVAEHISTTERIAQDAERESVKLKKLEYFQSQCSKGGGDVFQARILEVRNYGLFIELPDFLLSGLIHVSALEGDFYTLDTVRNRFVGRKSRRVYQAGDEIKVTVAKVDFFKQQVDFRPVRELKN